MPYVAHVPIRVRGTVGGSVSHADPAAELPAVMLLANAELRLQARGRERVQPANDFFRGFFETAIEPDELLVELRLPAWPAARAPRSPRWPAGTATSRSWARVR